ncbi:MAG: hypothetical protein KIT33_10945 [Candidatus Kapabacteria bacterium]|nr:hypothetical protein [Ignavibacteriota bacterium]MCW5885474.1 hypothetical protein [Candidatus Kapabacteria bacterium]
MAKKTTATSNKGEVEKNESKSKAKVIETKAKETKTTVKTATKVAVKPAEKSRTTAKKTPVPKAEVAENKTVSKSKPEAVKTKSVSQPVTKKETTSKSDEAKKKIAKKDTAKKEEPKVESPIAEIKEATPKKTKTPDPVKTELTEPPKFDVRYSDEDLEMFAGVINEAKSEALDELRMLKERLEDLTSFDSAEESMIYSMHMAEQGSEAQEKEKTYAQIQRISEHIKKLEDAMERIRNKSYGICRVCGCLIAKERLLAVPVTTLSASYKIHSKCPEDGLDKIEPFRG